MGGENILKKSRSQIPSAYGNINKIVVVVVVCEG